MGADKARHSGLEGPGRRAVFRGTPYVIFPGNVGEVQTLREAVEVLTDRDSG